MSAHVFLDGISLCAWIVTLVAGQRKICIGINLWKVSANTELCTMRFTLQTKTKKGGERNPQTPYVCLLVHSNFSSKHSHSVSYRSKTIQLPVVWIQMHNKWWPQETHTDTFRREALHLHAVWVLLHNSSWPQKTHRPPLHGVRKRGKRKRKEKEEREEERGRGKRKERGIRSRKRGVSLSL